MRITNIGFPNSYDFLIKNNVEGFWKKTRLIEDVEEAASKVVAFNKEVQHKLDLIPVAGDMDLYDRLMRTASIFGLNPSRFGTRSELASDLEKYLNIGRGTQSAPASPMVKWFNTNYHVVQPEIESLPKLQTSFSKPVIGQGEKYALIGPVTLLSYAINKTDFHTDEIFDALADEYASFINSYPADTVFQIEEPSFITSGIPNNYAESFINKLKVRTHLHVYFGDVKSLHTQLFALDVEAIGLDFVDGASNVDVLAEFPADKTLIAGVINGRNIWPASTRTQELMQTITAHIADDKLFISPSCSLMHLPVTKASDEDGQFVFAQEKIQELEQIANGSIEYKQISLQEEALDSIEYRRSRKKFWVHENNYPTTTIGSFPQTKELRAIRKQWRDGDVSQDVYDSYIRDYIKECIQRQEKLGLDVLVHGEPERADMVQYFAENFDGMTVIKGAVQSYGTRYVKPPVITSAVTRKSPFSVQWSSYAQSCTDKPVKGMLTGPVTLVQWSFPRDDISRLAQMYDIAGALAQEVNDLAAAGIKHIQIDEPAIREGLPLEKSQWQHYLFHAVNSFRKSYADVADDIVIHSHMCFSSFPDIMDAICDMGVDVLSVEDSKAKGKTAQSVSDGGFPASIGLGVYDVHSPRLADIDEMIAIPKLITNLDPKQVWINPDCGLKTRGQEAYTQLENMMQAVKQLRDNL